MSSTAPVTELGRMSAEGSDGSGALLPVIRGGDCHPRTPPGRWTRPRRRPSRTRRVGRRSGRGPRMQPTPRLLVGRVTSPRIVPLVIGTVLFVSGVVIFGRVPSTHDHVLAER